MKKRRSINFVIFFFRHTNCYVYDKHFVSKKFISTINQNISTTKKADSREKRYSIKHKNLIDISELKLNSLD